MGRHDSIDRGIYRPDPQGLTLTRTARLGIPVGSIGPTRRRCLDKLRRHPAIAALMGGRSALPAKQVPHVRERLDERVPFLAAPPCEPDEKVIDEGNSDH
jgi:hypothetical protein